MKELGQNPSARIPSIPSFGFIKNVNPQPPNQHHEGRAEFHEPGRSLHQLPGIKAQVFEQHDQPLGAQRTDKDHHDPGEPARDAPHAGRGDQQAQQKTDHAHRRQEVRADEITVDQAVQPIPHNPILQQAACSRNYRKLKYLIVPHK